MTGINLTAVYIADLLGAVLAANLLISNRWRIRDRMAENHYLMSLAVLVFVSCIADSVSFALDGKAGQLNRIMICVSNGWLYMMNVLCGLIWLRFFVLHMGLRIPKGYVLFLIAAGMIFLIILAINPFTGLAFRVNDRNVYERGPMFAVYLGLDLFFILNCLVVYIIARRKSGRMNFFPVWLFILPVAAGLAVQSAIYGISAIWPCMSISVTGVFLGVQNELIFRDKLTGLFNRYYLDYLRNSKIKRTDHTMITALMLDLNHFKEINDRWGHSVGDKALIATGDILKNIVNDSGTVLRYAGDEFVILLNTQDKQKVSNVVDEIHSRLSEYSSETDIDFELSVSVGQCEINLALSGIEELMKEADRRMYEEKRRTGDE